MTTSNEHLLEAASKNDYKRVSDLLLSGANPNVKGRDWGGAPLHRLISGAPRDSDILQTELAVLECVKDLVRAGADVNLVSNGNRTAIWYAAEKGFVRVVRFLVDQGADIDIASTDAPRKPLHMAKLMMKSSRQLHKDPARFIETLEYLESFNSTPENINTSFSPKTVNPTESVSPKILFIAFGAIALIVSLVAVFLNVF